MSDRACGWLAQRLATATQHGPLERVTTVPKTDNLRECVEILLVILHLVEHVFPCLELVLKALWRV
jgi:hypothetical protein